MSKLIKNIIRKVIGDEKATVLKEKLFALTNPKEHRDYTEYDVEADRAFNIQLLETYGDVHSVEAILAQSGLDWNDPGVSWHYHLFATLLSGKRDVKILEIGTHTGHFSEFLAKNFDCTLDTIDLPEEAEQFVSTYGRGDLEGRKKYSEARNARLSSDKITFHRMDSFNLLDKFSGKEFDLIWVDGDHLNPQVSLDLFSSLRLLKPTGFMCCDDIFMTPIQSDYASIESYQTLQKFDDKGVTKTEFLFKRVSNKNILQMNRKFISISRKIAR